MGNERDSHCLTFGSKGRQATNAVARTASATPSQLTVWAARIKGLRHEQNGELVQYSQPHDAQ